MNLKEKLYKTEKVVSVIECTQAQRHKKMWHFVFVLKCPYSLLAVSHNSESQWVALYSNFLFKANK